ncbi:adhesion G protein-coupled receptor B3-like isoform X1 [Lampetra fluviatilis]
MPSPRVLRLLLAACVSCRLVCLAAGLCGAETRAEGVFMGRFAFGGAQGAPRNASACCSRLVVNPDPGRHVLLLRFTKGNGSCAEYKLGAHAYDTRGTPVVEEEEVEETEDAFLDVCDSSSRVTFMQSDRKYVKLQCTREEARGNRPSLSGALSTSPSSPSSPSNNWISVDYIVMDKSGANADACRLFCDWLESCWCTENPRGHCTLAKSPCSCLAPRSDEEDIGLDSGPCNGRREGVGSRHLLFVAHDCDKASSSLSVPWSSWGICSEPCGGGLQMRSRACSGPCQWENVWERGRTCSGLSEEWRECNRHSCDSRWESGYTAHHTHSLRSGIKDTDGSWDQIPAMGSRSEAHEVCEEDHFWVTWRRTAAGESTGTLCPPNATGVLVRRCALTENGVAFWESPSFARCVSYEYRNLQQDIMEHLSKGHRILAGEGMSQVTKDLLDLSQQKRGYSGDLLASVEILANVTQTLKRANYNPSSEDVQNFVQVVSNLLSEENKEKWDDAQLIYPASIALMKIVEDFIHVMGNGIKNAQTFYLVTENLVINIYKFLITEDNTDIIFPMKGRNGMVEWARNLEDKMVVPKYVISSLPSEKGEFAVVGNILYKNIGLLLPITRNSTIVNSKVFALTMRPMPSAIDVPIEITLSHLNNSTTESFCVFWNYTQMHGRAEGWLGQPCATVLGDSWQTRCLCNGFSAFAILSPYPLPQEPKMDIAEASSFPLVIGCGVSSLALVCLMIMYCIFWRSIKSERSVILINFCVSIILSNSLIVAGQAQLNNKAFCTAIAAFLHFFFLASFCWVLTEAWQSYLAVTGQQRSKIVRKRFLCLGWGLPALIVAISVGFTKTKGYGTIQYCWLSLDGGLLYAFVGPAAGVVLVNMAICILVFNKLVSKEGIPDKKLKHTASQMALPHNGMKVKCSKCGVVSGSSLSASTASNAMASLWSSCVVLPLLALTWMSAVLAITDRRSALFQILFAVFDSLQGIVIMVVHSFLRKEVQDALKCRIRNTADQSNGESSGTFPNGHAEILSDFEKDVEMVCRSVLSKDSSISRTATMTTSMATDILPEQTSLEKPDYNPEVVSQPGYLVSNLPDIQLQQLSTSVLPMGMNDLGNYHLSMEIASGGQGPVYLCKGENMQDVELLRAQERALASDYVVLPRSAPSSQGGGGGAGGDGLEGNVDEVTLRRVARFNEDGTERQPMGDCGMDLTSSLLEAASMRHQGAPLEAAAHSSLRFGYGTLNREMLGQVLRSETSSTVSLNSLERRKCKYSELDVEKIMRTRKRHLDMFQDLNQKFQHVNKDRDISTVDLMKSSQRWSVSSAGSEKEKLTPSRSAWDGQRSTSNHMSPAWSGLACQSQPGAAEWEKAVGPLPLVAHEGDIQTEV